MSEWITDREPTAQDSDHMGQVWVTSDDGKVSRQWWTTVSKQPWMPIVQPEPYVKPKRYTAILHNGVWCVLNKNSIAAIIAFDIPTRKAAERIAAIYEEVMP